MSEPTTTEPETLEVELRSPTTAAILAWLIPGAGHFYQGRYGKGTIYLVCILGSYLFGLWLGGGHVVYASWAKEDKRWQFVCQAGVGLPVLPALIQNRRVMGNHDPLGANVLAPPKQPVIAGDRDELADWHLQYNWRYDLGTLYTMIAGLLNVLAVFDAYSGPMLLPLTPTAPQPRSGKPPKSDST